MGDELRELMTRLEVVYTDVGGRGPDAKNKSKDKYERLKTELVEAATTVTRVGCMCELARLGCSSVTAATLLHAIAARDARSCVTSATRCAWAWEARGMCGR